MRTLLWIFLLMCETARGADASDAAAVTIREKVRLKIMESLPPLPAPAPKPAADEKEKAEGAVVMKPMVVSESKLIHAVTAAIERQQQDRRDEKFTPLEGGRIATIAGMQVGGWWAPDEGWTFLRLNKTPTRRQREATEGRMKELQELQELGKGTGKPPP